MKSAAIALLFALAVRVPPDPTAIVLRDYATLPITGSPDGVNP
jgi:hypothetical protein